MKCNQCDSIRCLLFCISYFWFASHTYNLQVSCYKMHYGNEGPSKHRCTNVCMWEILIQNSNLHSQIFKRTYSMWQLKSRKWFVWKEPALWFIVRSPLKILWSFASQKIRIYMSDARQPEILQLFLSFKKAQIYKWGLMRYIFHSSSLWDPCYS